MKATVKIEKEVDIKTLHVSAGVRYWEDARVNGVEDTEGNLMPFRNGENWEPVIDIDKGQIINWPKGTTADIHFKVCDAGTYTLKDIDGNTVLKKEGYVPGIMCPDEDGWGDYIIMTVSENGLISNWNPNIDDFYE